MDTIETIENERVALQECLDLCKTQEERNRLGQFPTPTLLAEEILQYAVQLMKIEAKVSFLDPAIGTRSFYSALNKTVSTSQIELLALRLTLIMAIPQPACGMSTRYR